MNDLPNNPPFPPVPPLDTLQDVDALSDYLRHGREAILARIRSRDSLTDNPFDLTRAHSDLVDRVIRRMLTLACERVGRGAAPTGLGLAIIATGGYGRRELCPHSDIDITFLPHRDGDPLLDRIIKEMYTYVMRVFIDGNRMGVGYAYRLFEDFATLDHQTSCGLLDARLIIGNDRLFIRFEDAFWSQFNPTDFVFAKLAERHKQQEKAGGTARVVEPDVKEGVGGLRDLHAAVWVTQARKAVDAASVRGERVWQTLEREADLTRDEIRRLREAKLFLFRVRNALHTAAGEERDQLVVTRQEEIARMLGYRDETVPDEMLPVPAVERFMRDYYAHAATLHRISEDVMRHAENSRLLLGIGLDCRRKQIVRANPALACEDPVWLLWACELSQKYGLTWSDELERCAVELLDTKPLIQDRRLAAEIFTRILASSQGAYSTVQRMADLGILDWLLPEVGAIMNLIPYDASHDYTVGQHSLYVVRNLDTLRLPEPTLRNAPPETEEQREFRQLMSELPHPEQLVLAALLHDAGKTMEDRPHAEVGEEIARRVCQRLGWDAQASANVAFLVRHHLQMAETSRLRDLTMQETLRDFSSVVEDLDRLQMLYLLTYADTSAVGAGVWTQVQGRFLRELFHRAADYLSRRTNPDANDAAFADAMLSRTRRRLLKELAVENLPDDEVQEHIAGMPAAYLLNTSREAMALDIGAVRRARKGIPTVDFFDERDATFSEITVTAPDDPQPGLLAKIAGVFYASDLDVHSAQVYTRILPLDKLVPDNGTVKSDVLPVERIAIDRFYVDFRGRQLTPGKRHELNTHLHAVLAEQVPVADILRKKRKACEIGGTVERLSVRNDLSSTYTVLEVAFSDRRAMLYRASGALSALGWDIHSARVSLFKGRHTASFYVTGARSLSEQDARHALLRLMPLS